MPTFGPESPCMRVVEPHNIDQGNGRFLSRRIDHDDDILAQFGDPLLLLAHEPVGLLFDAVAGSLKNSDLAV